jgi:hypothetical protein
MITSTELAARDVYGIQPKLIIYRNAVNGISQEMHLMNVHRMNFMSRVDDLPMLISAYLLEMALYTFENRYSLVKPELPFSVMLTRG